MPERAVSTGHEVGNTERFSSLAVRAGGANLLYVNAELHGHKKALGRNPGLLNA